MATVADLFGQLSLSDNNWIDINFERYDNMKVREVNIGLLERLLITDKPNVVFFGEANFTFSEAFATLNSRRLGWNYFNPL